MCVVGVEEFFGAFLYLDPRLEHQALDTEAWGFNEQKALRNVTPVFRIIAALAQVFVTHSTATWILS